jgi:hypothetical protein
MKDGSSSPEGSPRTDAPNGIAASTIADTANVAALISITPSAPTSGNAAAASAGPTVRPVSVIPPYSDVTVGSRSRSTRLGSAARAAGE